MIQFLTSNRFVLGMFAALSVPFAQAQTPSKQPVPKVSFQYLDAPPQAGSGKTPAASSQLVVHVELQEGWHINSEAPLDSFLVPTTLDIKAEGLAFGKPVYPKPVLQHSDVMGGDLSLYTGAFDVRVPCAPGDPARKPPAGAARPRTRVTLNYQACNNNMCLPPKSVTVEQ
ncbi:MAG TPA: protein-disulfide reductase DsbD domain-containing protein [Fibrobacteria bacterium]|nr:protein-disulfide reductase DsbD domain-containing protein [Fibrobacteria bacterium]